MTISVSDLQTQLDALIRARAACVRSVSHGDERTEFKSDAEMAAAIADLEKRIALAQGVRPPSTSVGVYDSGLKRGVISDSCWWRR